MRSLAPVGRFRWQDFEGSQAGRSADRIPDQIGAGDQPDGGQGAGPDGSADVARARRRGDRVEGRRQAKLARSAGASPAEVRPSESPGSECCVRRRGKPRPGSCRITSGNNSPEKLRRLSGVPPATAFGLDHYAQTTQGRAAHDRCAFFLDGWTWFVHSGARSCGMHRLLQTFGVRTTMIGTRCSLLG